jgi:hypothetical protein
MVAGSLKNGNLWRDRRASVIVENAEVPLDYVDNFVVIAVVTASSIAILGDLSSLQRHDAIQHRLQHTWSGSRCVLRRIVFLTIQHLSRLLFISPFSW